MQVRPRPGGWPAPLVAACCLGVVVVTIAVLGFSASDGSRAGDDLAGDIAWYAWLAIGAMSVLFFTLAFLFGLDVLSDPERWGLRSVLSRRWWYVGIAFGFVLLLALFQWFNGISPDLPIAHLEARTRGLLWCGLVTATPWLALVWLVRD